MSPTGNPGESESTGMNPEFREQIREELQKRFTKQQIDAYKLKKKVLKGKPTIGTVSGNYVAGKSFFSGSTSSARITPGMMSPAKWSLDTVEEKTMRACVECNHKFQAGYDNGYKEGRQDEKDKKPERL